MGISCVVLFSGGQDSTTCLYWAKREFSDVRAIAFDYGQRHAIELKQAQKIADGADVPLQVLDLKGLLSTCSALTNPQMATSGQHPNDPKLPATFVPARNALFLTAACGIAYTSKVVDLVTGVCQTDFSGYPDCRRVFIDSMEVSLSLGLGADIRIHTPLMYLDKADTFKLAEDLGVLDVVLEESHTDYHGDRSTRHEWGYGNLDNEASLLRAKGWEEFKRRYRHA